MAAGETVCPRRCGWLSARAIAMLFILLPYMLVMAYAATAGSTYRQNRLFALVPAAMVNLIGVALMIRTGQVVARSAIVDRRERPVLFWMLVLGYAAPGIGLLVVGFIRG